MSRGRPGSDGGRAQANLVALIAALFALTAVTLIAVALANGALAGESRDPGERHAAAAVSDRLVSNGSPLTNRSNVLDPNAVRELSAADLRSRYPTLDDRQFSVSLDGEVLAASGSPAGGTTVRRIVLVERTERRTMYPQFSAGNIATLPRRTDRVQLDVSPPENVSVSVVRANDRTVLRDPDGLEGEYTVPVTRRETVQFTFLANGSLERGSVELAHFPRETTKAELAVTVDD